MMSQRRDGQGAAGGRPFCSVVLLLICSLALVSMGPRLALAGRVARAEGLEVSVDGKWPMQSAGYFPVRISIKNMEDARQLELRLRVGGVREVVRTVSLEEQSAARVTMPVPVVAGSGSCLLSVLEGGRPIPKMRQHVPYHNWDEGVAPLLIISDRIEDTSQLQTGFQTLWGSGNFSRYVCQISRDDMPRWWISYSQLGAILASANAVEKMSPEQTEDLRKWVAMGGNLHIYRAAMSAIDPLARILGQEYSLGDPRTTMDHYFGTVSVIRDDAFRWQPGDWQRFLGRTLSSPYARLSQRMGLGHHGGVRMTVSGVGEVPVGGYAALMTLFAIGIGPITYFLLKRKKKLYLLFAITPVAAVAVTIAMSIYGLLSEGLGVRGKSASLTYLDQKRHEAVTMGRIALYASMSPRGGLQFPMETAVYPAGGELGGGELLLGESQHFTGGWLRSRTMTNFVTCSIAPTRTRLRVKRTERGLEVANELGVYLDEIALKDESGRVYMASDIRSGARAVAAPSTDTLNEIRDLMHAISASGIGLLSKAQFEEGCFVAELERSPYFVTGLRSLDEKDSRHILYGRFSEGE